MAGKKEGKGKGLFETYKNAVSRFSGFNTARMNRTLNDIKTRGDALVKKEKLDWLYRQRCWERAREIADQIEVARAANDPDIGRLIQTHNTLLAEYSRPYEANVS